MSGSRPRTDRPSTRTTSRPSTWSRTGHDRGRSGPRDPLAAGRRAEGPAARARGHRHPRRTGSDGPATDPASGSVVVALWVTPRSCSWAVANRWSGWLHCLRGAVVNPEVAAEVIEETEERLERLKRRSLEMDSWWAEQAARKPNWFPVWRLPRPTPIP